MRWLRSTIRLASAPVLKQRMAPKSDMAAFKKELSGAKHILVLTGAGISAESGIPTFRGAGGLWRTYAATDLATPEAFARDPSLVWEFYTYRRNLVLSKQPNPAHYALAELEKKAEAKGRKVSVVTQNIDELHKKAGTKNLIELHGCLFKVRCIGCGHIEFNYEDPICPALAGKGAPDPKTQEAKIPRDQLPKCSQCSEGLIRPHVVWFGESLETEVLLKNDQIMDDCDLCMVIGTSSVVYPAAMFAPALASRGVTVAEFNVEDTQATQHFGYHFSGPASETVVAALADY